MPKHRTIRTLIVPVALLALLMLTTVGCVWHHHANSTDTNCSICHLNHQAMERPLAADRAPALALLGSYLDPLKPEFVSGPAVPSIPARAPPCA